MENNLQSKKSYHERLKDLMNELVNKIYDLTIDFPKSEMFGLTSQIRRAAMSVILNYIEGYARGFVKKRNNVLKSFLEISFGSLKETEYLIDFSREREYIQTEDYEINKKLTNEIGKMLWGIVSRL